MRKQTDTFFVFFCDAERVSNAHTRQAEAALPDLVQHNLYPPTYTVVEWRRQHQQMGKRRFAALCAAYFALCRTYTDCIHCHPAGSRGVTAMEIQQGGSLQNFQKAEWNQTGFPES